LETRITARDPNSEGKNIPICAKVKIKRCIKRINIFRSCNLIPKCAKLDLSLLNIIDSYSHSGTDILKLQGTSKTVLHFWQYKFMVL
jgi:hypothetical protein